tara:strand:+ start:633 stop:782 length:150 start_codon:yes stop_codon:yes gene_type:complete
MTKRDLVEILNSKIASCEAEILNNDQWDVFNKGRKDGYQDILRVLNETK